MCVDIVRRLKQYMEHVGLPSTQFADVAKIARPTISQLLNGRNRKVSNELIEKLHIAFPDLNIMWLMFGDGPMEVSNSKTADSIIQPTLFNNVDEPEEKPAANSVHPSAVMQTYNLRKQSAHTSSEKNVESKEPSIHIPVNANNGMRKKIQTIMVCYTDNSFEIFTPAQ